MKTINLARIGYLSACIAGDRRYTDTLEVWYSRVDDTVTVTVRNTTASGGMDGRGGSDNMGEQFRETSKPGATAAEIVKMIKGVTGNDRWNFKRYGKPTKNFEWRETGAKGLSASLCSAELALFRESE